MPHENGGINNLNWPISIFNLPINIFDWPICILNLQRRNLSFLNVSTKFVGNFDRILADGLGWTSLPPWTSQPAAAKTAEMGAKISATICGKY